MDSSLGESIVILWIIARLRREHLRSGDLMATRSFGHGGSGFGRHTAPRSGGEDDEGLLTVQGEAGGTRLDGRQKADAPSSPDDEFLGLAQMKQVWQELKNKRR